MNGAECLAAVGRIPQQHPLAHGGRVFPGREGAPRGVYGQADMVRDEGRRAVEAFWLHETAAVWGNGEEQTGLVLRSLCIPGDIEPARLVHVYGSAAVGTGGD